MSDNNSHSSAGQKLESSRDHAKKALDAAAEAGSAVGETVKKHAKAAYETGREHLGAAARDLGEAANASYKDLRGKAAHRADEFKDRANTLLDDTAARARECQTEAEAYIRQNPLQSVAIAVGVGFILGIMLRR
jgi:ElaB/YqjD/DUF883 family membrane-anchored ribosome-binding protein